MPLDLSKSKKSIEKRIEQICSDRSLEDCVENLENSYEEQMCTAITEELEKMPRKLEETKTGESAIIQKSPEIPRDAPQFPDECTDLLPFVVCPIDIKNEPSDDQPVEKLVDQAVRPTGRKVEVDEILDIKTEVLEVLEKRMPPAKGRPLKNGDERFKRKFEWGYYYEKYKIPKSQVACIWENCNYRVGIFFSLFVCICIYSRVLFIFLIKLLIGIT